MKFVNSKVNPSLLNKVRIETHKSRLRTKSMKDRRAIDVAIVIARTLKKRECKKRECEKKDKKKKEEAISWSNLRVTHVSPRYAYAAKSSYKPNRSWNIQYLIYHRYMGPKSPAPAARLGRLGRNAIAVIVLSLSLSPFSRNAKPPIAIHRGRNFSRRPPSVLRSEILAA